MSFLKKASLLTIPTAYKQGKLYSVKPDDGSGDFTFTRSTSATRVNEAGLIEKERENLLLYSNDFSQWINLYSTETGGQVGYDGSNDAWLLTDSASNLTNYRIFIPVNQNGIYTFSVYAKAGTKDIVYLKSYINNNNIGYFDLTNGTVLTTNNCIDSKIESIGNGWYRCSIVFNQPNDYVTIGMAETTVQSYVGDGTGTIYIQDAQLEAGLVATDYIETTTTTVSTGIVENVPRIDYSSGTPALLLEPQRTNLVLQSEDFGNYININSTDVSNVTISPEGFTNATSFLEAATTGQHKLFTSFNFDGTSTYTFSIFAKHNGRDLFIDTQDSNEWSGRAWFDLTNGTANAILGTAAIEDFGNGWYRCIVTGISNIAGANFVELLTSDGSTNSITGDITKGVYIYGCQLEQGSYATSYIPTYGTSVTRTLDYTILDDLISLGLVTATELTFFIDLNAESLIRESSAVDIIFGNVSSNGIFIYNNALNSINGIIYLRDGSTTETESLTQSPSKICIKVKPNDVKVFINGLNVKTSTSLNFDFSSSSRLVLQSKSRTQIVNKLLFFPTALSDADCEILTGEAYSSFEAMANSLNYTIYG